MKTPIKSKLNQAFSLVELLVVIAVIAIIAAIAIPNITGIREGAKASKLASDAASVERRIGEAAAMGNTVTVQQVLDGITVTDPDTQQQVTLQVASDFTAAEIEAAIGGGAAPSPTP